MVVCCACDAIKIFTLRSTEEKSFMLGCSDHTSPTSYQILDIHIDVYVVYDTSKTFFFRMRVNIV